MESGWKEASGMEWKFDIGKGGVRLNERFNW